MKQIKILKISIIIVVLLILATIIYAGYRMTNKSNKEEETVSAIIEEQVGNDEKTGLEKQSHTEIVSVGVKKVETFLIQEAERIAEEEKKKQEEEEKNKKDQEEKEEDESFKKVTGSSTYYIRVNYQANTVTIYTKDSEGNYTIPFKVMVCSCGTWTPKSGTYSTTDKYKWRALVGGVSGKYATRITGQILFHSVPYVSQSSDSLEYWEYDKLGTTASLGCVRLQVADAKWIYDNCGWGTLVEFYGSSNPGPLGKPVAQKISSNEECRGWDPTDPESGNPWHTYEDEEKDEKVEEEKKETATKKDEKNTETNSSTINNTTNNNTNKEETSEDKKQEVTKEENNSKEDIKEEETTPKEDESEENIPEDNTQEENTMEEEIPEENDQENNNQEEAPEENVQEEETIENNNEEIEVDAE